MWGRLHPPFCLTRFNALETVTLENSLKLPMHILWNILRIKNTCISTSIFLFYALCNTSNADNCHAICAFMERIIEERMWFFWHPRLYRLLEVIIKRAIDSVQHSLVQYSVSSSPLLTSHHHAALCCLQSHSFLTITFSQHCGRPSIWRCRRQQYSYGADATVEVVHLQAQHLYNVAYSVVRTV